MVSRPNGLALANAAQKTITVDGSSQKEFFSDGPSADIIAGFSSRGPAFIGTKLLAEIKPDVVAPGVNVYSSILMSSCSSPPCFAFFQGTSMATPHVAGSAALLKQLHPDWSPQQIKSALVNSAKRPVGSSSNASPLANPMDRGSGRIDLAAASKITATIDAHKTVSLNFGQLSASMGDIADLPIKAQSVTSNSVTYAVSVSPAFSSANMPTVTISTSALTLGAGGGGNVKVTVATSSTTATGDYFGDIVLTGGTVTLNIPYWVEIIP
jgi:subtilisin family serine protease